MSARDEISSIISSAAHGPSKGTKLTRTMADALVAAGCRLPRTITDHYEDNGTDSLACGSVIISHSEALLAQSDGTFVDPAGSTWDFWELELPITVLYEPL